MLKLEETLPYQLDPPDVFFSLLQEMALFQVTTDEPPLMVPGLLPEIGLCSLGFHTNSGSKSNNKAGSSFFH